MDFLFFFKCLAQKQEKITYVLRVTIVISSYVIQHRNHNNKLIGDHCGLEKQ